MMNPANREHLMDQLTRVEAILRDCIHELQGHKSSVTIPDLYEPMGSLVAITSAIRGLLNTFPVLSEFDPSEFYHSEGKNPGQFMRGAEIAITAAVNDLGKLEAHLNEAWSDISPLGIKATK